MTPRRLSALLGGLAAILVVGLMAALLLSGHATLGLGGPSTNETPQQRFARLGGVELVLRVACPSSGIGCDLNQRLPAFQSAIARRAAAGLGVTPAVRVPLVKATYTDIVVDLPGYTDQQKATALLGASGELDFVDAAGAPLTNGADVHGKLCTTSCKSDDFKIIASGNQVDPNSVTTAIDPRNGQHIVTFNFTGAARAQFAEFARQHSDDFLNVVQDGIVVESVQFRAQTGNQSQLTLYPADAPAFAALLKSGPLPLTVADVQASYVKPGGASTQPCAASTPTPAPGGGWISSSGRATSTPAPTPTATTATKSGLIQNVVTATGVDNKLFPTGVTSQFPVNSSVYVVMAVQGVHPGETHTISIRWFLNGQDLQLPPTAGTSITVSGDRQIYFSLTYPQPGAGTAKIYVDRPASDTGDTPNDPALAATVSFDVELQGAAPTPAAGSTPTAAPIGSGGAATTAATPGGCATPTDTATPGSSGAATPSGTATPTPPATPTPTPPPA